MRKLFFTFCIFVLLFACNNEADKTVTTTTPAATETKTVDLPYKASYTSSWDKNVSDEDLKMVLTSYQDWVDGNIDGLMNAIGDSIWIDSYSGTSANYTKADVRKMWTTSRDSLASTVIDMQAWEKMHSTDKNDSFVVVWYKQIDTYKTGKIDSAQWHDINQVKGGKIVVGAFLFRDCSHLPDYHHSGGDDTD